jgi:hypothetical protein
MPKSIYSSWFLWTIVTAIGSTVGFPLGYVIGDYFFPDLTVVNNGLKIPFLLIVITTFGLVIGFGQWTTFRARLEKSWVWIPITSIGFPLGFIIGFLAHEIIYGYVFEWASPFIMPSVAGMFIGSLQCLALSRKLKTSFMWILISGLSWGIVLNQETDKYINDFIITPYIQTTNLQLPVYGFLIGLVVGTISGIFVESVLINPRPDGKLFV